MTPPTKEQLDELRVLERRATPGPWEFQTANSMRQFGRPLPHGSMGGVAHGYVAQDGVPDIAIGDQDAALIVAARNLLHALLADHERLQVENAELKAACPCRVARRARTEAEIDKIIGETTQECRQMDRETLISHYACSLANQDAALDELEKARAENARLRGLLERWQAFSMAGGHGINCYWQIDGTGCACPGPDTVAALKGDPDAR